MQRSILARRSRPRHTAPQSLASWCRQQGSSPTNIFTGRQKETTMIWYLIGTLAMLLALGMAVAQAARSMGADFDGY
jgi:hypothetical protein